MPRASFNVVIHSPVRLRICALLRRVAELEFAVVRDTLELSDANLSKNLKVLSEHELVSIHKGRSTARADRRRLTWISLTSQGRSAVEGHLAALAEITASELIQSGDQAPPAVD